MLNETVFGGGVYEVGNNPLLKVLALFDWYYFKCRSVAAGSNNSDSNENKLFKI